MKNATELILKLPNQVFLNKFEKVPVHYFCHLSFFLSIDVEQAWDLWYFLSFQGGNIYRCFLALVKSTRMHKWLNYCFYITIFCFSVSKQWIYLYNKYCLLPEAGPFLNDNSLCTCICRLSQPISFLKNESIYI